MRILLHSCTLAVVISLTEAAPADVHGYSASNLTNNTMRRTRDHTTTKLRVRTLAHRTPLPCTGRATDATSATWILPEFAQGINAHDDPNPEEPAYVSPGTGTDGVEIDNPEDYDLDDMAEGTYQQSDDAGGTKSVRSGNLGLLTLHRRFPVDWKTIVSAPTKLNYRKAFFEQPTTKQFAYYAKEVKSRRTWDFVERPLSKKLPQKAGAFNVEHVVEIQRVKTIFRHPMPAGVSKKAWDLMQVAVDRDTNSANNQVKERLGGILNSVNNLRLFQERPNWLKGKICAFVDSSNIPGTKTTAVGPHFSETWSRSNAWAVAWYLDVTSSQYVLTVDSVSQEISKQTSDQALADWVKATLLDLQQKDKDFVRAQLMKPIGKDGDVFETEDMVTLPPLPSAASGAGAPTATGKN